MTPGMRITARTTAGTMVITAVDELVRCYTWEGATRCVEMGPTTDRQGLYYPGPGDHWKEHHGITRGVVQEGQQHFKTVKQARAWIRSMGWSPYVYRDDGLFVVWGKELSRKQLNVEVWQIAINGKKPHKLPRSRNKRITVTTVAVDPSPLVRAVRLNDAQTAMILLDRGANPNVKDRAGRSVLIAAVKRGSAPLITALLKKGADPDAHWGEGTTALTTAVQNDRTDIIKVLLENGANVNAALTRGMLEGWTPLMWAAMTGSDAAAKALLEKGPQVNATDTRGETALHKAASMSRSGVIGMLLERGAAVDGRSWYGMTPLMLAVQQGDIASVRTLIQHGANVNARIDEARLQIGRAGFIGGEPAVKQLVKELVRQGKDPSVLRETGTSVLDWAKLRGKKEIIELLKKAGARS
jgi:ankyrin repeat protein